MTQKEAELMNSPVEKVDENHAPELVEHLSSAQECSTNNLGDQIEAKKLIAQERNKRKRANLKKKRELSRNLKVDENHAPELVEHLSSARECSTNILDDQIEAKKLKAQERIKRKRANLKKKRELARNLKVDEKHAPELVEHLSSARECSTNILDDQIEAKKLKAQERIKRKRANLKKKRELSRNLSSLSDGVSPATLGMQENSAKFFSLEPSAQAPVSAHSEELTGELVMPPNAAEIKGLEGHTQVDSNSEAMEMEPLKRNRRDRRKKKLLSDPSFLNDGGVLNIQGFSAKDSPVEVLDQLPTSAYTEVVSVNGPTLFIKENDANPVNESTSGNKEEIETENLGKIIEESSEQLNKDKLDTGCGTLKRKKRVRKKRKLSSDPSSLNDGSLMDIQGTSAEDSPAVVLDEVPIFAYTDELMEKAVSVNDPTLLIKENDSHPVNESASGDKKEIEIEISEKCIEEHDVLYDAPFKYVSEKCSGQFKKDKLNTGSVTFKIEHMPQDATTISSEISENTDDDDDVSQPEIGNEGSLPESPGVPPVQLKKKLLVLDVNGILTDIVAHVSEEYTPDTTISRKAAFKRPFCDDFLRFCFEKFHVGVWSSRTMRNVKSAVDFLMGDLQDKLLFCWDQTQCTDTGFNTLENREKPMLLKELKKLWEKHEPSLPWERGDYNESNTLLLDDSPYKALQNPPYTAIFPNPYCYKDVKDNSLGPGGDLRAYLEGLASADDVQKYVEANPFGQRAITNANASWNFYRKVIRDTSLHTKRNYS